jgi:hypothetical protein
MITTGYFVTTLIAQQPLDLIAHCPIRGRSIFDQRDPLEGTLKAHGMPLGFSGRNSGW